jgi:hypothetical protein
MQIALVLYPKFTVQLAIEYDPQPPFDAGSPSKAPDETVELVRAVLQEVIDAS